MKPYLLSQPSQIFSPSFPIWLRCFYGITLALSFGLFCLTFFAYDQHTGFTQDLVPVLFVALTLAVCLNIYSIWHFRKEHRKTDQAFRNTDCESSSIFENALDGILIVDQEGICLDANPAAVFILRKSRQELIGQPVRSFYAEPALFDKIWKPFLDRKYSRGQAQLVAGNGDLVVVDFTAAANYLPGRHVFILCDATERKRTEVSLRKSQQLFQLMADNIQEVFWMLKADTKEIVYTSNAYETITGRSLAEIRENPSSYKELVHPEDRARFLARLDEAGFTGKFDEEFRIVRPDGVTRWIWSRGFPAPAFAAAGAPQWLVGIAQDITSRKQAEMQVTKHLNAAEAARAEAEALRKSTLALSQNLAMDSVLDTLLHCIKELIPFDTATILFVEDGADLMVAREAPRLVPKRIGLTFNVSDHPFLQRTLFEKQAILLPDVSREPKWQGVQPLDRIQSWLGVPLIAAGHVLGILSLGTQAPNLLAPEHLRLAKSLAVSAAVAIKNARLHERAEIYAAELEVRLRELAEAQKALEHAERNSLPTHGPS